MISLSLFLFADIRSVTGSVSRLPEIKDVCICLVVIVPMVIGMAGSSPRVQSVFLV